MCWDEFHLSGNATIGKVKFNQRTQARFSYASGEFPATNFWISSQSELAAERSLLLQASHDMIGFVFIQAMANRMTHFVFHGGV